MNTKKSSMDEETAKNYVVIDISENSVDEETALNYVVDETNKICMDIDKNKNDFVTVREGKAKVSFPSSHNVFYNPADIFSRDLSMAILRQFFWCENDYLKSLGHGSKDPQKEPKKLKVLEAVAASGLKSIRIAKETPCFKQIIANDGDKVAFTTIERNIKDNLVEHIVQPSNEDASLLMYKNRHLENRFDIVVLDPYGSVSSLLDAAVQCINNGGLLIVKCNDSAILRGREVDACHAKYGAICDEISCSQEMALRILLQAIESHANRYGRYIVPLLSLSQNTYMQVFVRIFTSPDKVKDSVCKISSVYVCSGCESFYLQPLGKKLRTTIGPKYLPAVFPPKNAICSICGYSYKICGPIWSDKIHNKEFLKKTVKSLRKRKEEGFSTSGCLISLLHTASMELEDAPLFYHLKNLFQAIQVTPPSLLQMRSAILNAGYKVSVTHCVQFAVKTNAPHDVIWQIAAEWAKLNIRQNTSKDDFAEAIMSKKSSFDVSFEPHPYGEDKCAKFRIFVLKSHIKIQNIKGTNKRNRRTRIRKRKKNMDGNDYKRIRMQ